MQNRDPRLWPYGLSFALTLLIPFNLLASLAMDIYLPALATMPATLGTTPNVVQWTLTLYLVLLGLGQLIFGPISDRIGRRPVLALGAALFACASFGLGMTSNAGLFLALRALQALGAAALLVALFATIRDLYADRPESAAIYSLMNALLSLIPALGPILGALVIAQFGWQAIFNLLGATALLLALVILPFWHETRPVQVQSARLTLSQLLKSQPFWAYTLAFAAAMGSFFTLFSTAPRLLIGGAGYSALHFSLAFASVALVMILAARSAAPLAQIWGEKRTALTGLALMGLGATLHLAAELTLSPSFASIILPMWITAFGITLTGSVTANGALSGFGAAAGLAVAWHFALQSLITGGIGTLAVLALNGDTLWPLITYTLGMAGLSALALRRL